MLDVPSLERRWLKYKLKRIIPYTIAFFITALVLTVVIIINVKHNNPILKQKIQEFNTTKVSSITETPLILEPSMQFVQSLPSLTAVIPPSTPSNIITKVVIPPKLISPITTSQLKPPLPLVPSVLQPSSLKKPSTINRDTVTFDIHEIEDRFQNNSNPHLGLYIARYHYDHGNYSEAYNYALKTNAINNTIEESWLIFAKSMVKLGKSDQAKKTLQLYISQSNSDSARSLLESLEKGESK